jgi:hypothetical protein
MTAKTLATAEEIRAEIERRMHGAGTLNPCCLVCRAPDVRPAQHGHTGKANWVPDELVGIPVTCRDLVMCITVQVMEKYDLRDR